jgi:4-hydroxy-2-oxoheptanedioate aldolase
MSKFKELIKKGDRAIGIWQTIPSIQLCHSLIKSGLDFIIFDMEHSVFDFKNALEHSLLCKANDVGAVVRISHFDKQLVSLAYDIGADVIQIPNIKTVAEVKEITKVISYEQEKGYSPFTVSEDYTGIKNKEKPLISIHIENKEIMHGLDGILDLNNVDIFFFGLFDISRSYNLLGDIRNREIVKDVRICMEKIKSREKIVGFIINDVNDIADFKEYGTYITYSSDVFLIKKTLSDSIAKLKSI